MRRSLPLIHAPAGPSVDSSLGTPEWTTSPADDAHAAPGATTTTTPALSGCISTASIVAPRLLSDNDDLAATLSPASHRTMSRAAEEAADEMEEEAAAVSVVFGRREDDAFSEARIPQLDGVNDGRKHAQHSAASSSSYQVFTYTDAPYRNKVMVE